MKSEKSMLPYGSKIHLRSQISKFTFNHLFDIHKAAIGLFSGKDCFNINAARKIAAEVIDTIDQKYLAIERKNREGEIEKASEINFDIPSSIKARLIREMLNDPQIKDLDDDEFLYGAEGDLKGISHTCLFFSLLNIVNQYLSVAFIGDPSPISICNQYFRLPNYVLKFNHSDVGFFFDWTIQPVIGKNGEVSKTREKYILRVLEGDGVTGPLYQPKNTPEYKYAPIEFQVDISENNKMLRGVMQSHIEGFSIIHGREGGYIVMY